MRFLTLHQKIDEIYHLYFLDLITKFQNNLLQYSKQLIPPIILLPDLRSRVFFISKLQQDCVSFFRSLVTPVICNIWFIIFFIDTGNSTWSIRSQNNTCKSFNYSDSFLCFLCTIILQVLSRYCALIGSDHGAATHARQKDTAQGTQSSLLWAFVAFRTKLFNTPFFNINNILK